MKKLVGFLLSAALFAGCGTDRNAILKVYNWSDYIDETMLAEFEQWYQEQTGEQIQVVYQTFDINETMLSKIEKGHEDYDVVCPSDYIIERMLSQDLLLPIDRDFGETPDYTQSISPYIKACFDKINGNGKNANDYSVGYMWGSTGILYNPKYVTEEEASTWNVIRNPKFADKILIKDAPRDVYAPVLIYLRQEELQNGTVTLDDLMYDSSDKSVADVEAFMNDVRPLVAGWEADFGKEQMTQERAWVSLNWSGDAVWAIDEAAEVGVELQYVVPEEGSTVWFDGWVIPKYAKNIKAARYFINYMCMPENAIRNSDFTGYVSVNGAPEVLEAMIDEEYDPIDISYFFEGADSVCVDPALYPDSHIISLCTMEHDWGEDTAKLIAMWSRVKGESANATTVVVIVAVIVVLAVLVVRKKLSSKSRRSKKRK